MELSLNLSVARLNRLGRSLLVPAIGLPREMMQTISGLFFVHLISEIYCSRTYFGISNRLTDPSNHRLNRSVLKAEQSSDASFRLLISIVQDFHIDLYLTQEVTRLILRSLQMYERLAEKRIAYERMIASLINHFQDQFGRDALASTRDVVKRCFQPFIYSDIEPFKH